MEFYDNLNRQRERLKKEFQRTKEYITAHDKLVHDYEFSTQYQVVYDFSKCDILSFPRVRRDGEIIGRCCEIHVTKNRTIDEAIRATKDFPGSTVGILNFGSGTTPGGGVLRGSSAQEECICRTTTLYYPLCDLGIPESRKVFDQFYRIHREANSRLYSDRVIYTPRVTIIRDDGLNFLPEDKWVHVDVLTAAAPNMRNETRQNPMNPNDSRRPITLSEGEHYEIMKKRIASILEIAEARRINVLILGAFGCGAFRNPPVSVANVFNDLLQKEGYKNYFKAIIFAVYCRKNDMMNYDVFNTIIQKQTMI